jgi:hypothetical protein
VNVYLAAAATDAALPSLAVYGVAAFPITLLLWAVKWQQSQLVAKDMALEKLNERLLRQSEQAIAQAEKLAPLISEAARVIDAALRGPPPRSDR